MMNFTDSTISNIEVVDPDSTRALYEEALADLQADTRTDAKRVIAERIKEIQRLRALLAKAETDLAELLKKDVEEVALLGGFSW